MASRKQRRAASKNIRKAQRVWQQMSSRQRSRAQPEGRSRAKPGRSGGGDYFHIEVRDKRQFSSFRTQDVGKPGGIQRVAGRRNSGSWDTVKWLIAKDRAHVSDGGRLVPDRQDARKVLNMLGSTPRHVTGSYFRAKPRKDVPEKDKPTAAQRRARRQNIKKAQAARWG